jgi:tRNA pseudouridine55 synthase
VVEFRTRRAPADGVVLIDKPAGCTSHDVVARVRRMLRPTVKKVGHAGTLDPFATGLLLILVGRGTKLARFFVDLPKEYECTMRFGVASDTGDRTGVLTETGVSVDRAQLEAVLPRFIGRIDQQVPMTSAVKIDGERLYKKAHRGEVVETPVKTVEVTAIDLIDFDGDTQLARCRIRCSKGTYVRQLATDIGEATGAGAHLQELSRTATGDFSLEDAVSLGEFEESAGGRAVDDLQIPGLVPPARALQFLPALEMSAAQAAAVRNGARLPGGHSGPVRLVFKGELIAIYGPLEEGSGLKPLVIL